MEFYNQTTSLSQADREKAPLRHNETNPAMVMKTSHGDSTSFAPPWRGFRTLQRHVHPFSTRSRAERRAAGLRRAPSARGGGRAIRANSSLDRAAARRVTTPPPPPNCRSGRCAAQGLGPPGTEPMTRGLHLGRFIQARLWGGGALATQRQKKGPIRPDGPTKS